MSSSQSPTALRVMALEPWLGGSHRAFLSAFRESSRHTVQVHGLAARHWKWRMCAGAWDLAREVEGQEPPDVLLVSDFLDLPAFMGFAPPSWAGLPLVLYMHENQLTYPRQDDQPQLDTSYGFTNILSCVRADRVVFNSDFHRQQFAAAACELLRQVPRRRPLQDFEAAIASSQVIAPGVELGDIQPGPGNANGPLRILFPHRWEYDKDPLEFLEAMLELRERRLEFELVLLGEQFEEVPPGVARALEELREQVVFHGFAPTREQYVACLGQCDVVISTALHEFFGIAIVEAMAAGVQPLLPHRLSYPELLGPELSEGGLYATRAELVERLARFASAPASLRAPELRARVAARSRVGSRCTSTPALDELLTDIRSRTPFSSPREQKYRTP